MAPTRNSARNSKSNMARLALIRLSNPVVQAQATDHGRIALLLGNSSSIFRPEGKTSHSTPYRRDANNGSCALDRQSLRTNAGVKRPSMFPLTSQQSCARQRQSQRRGLWRRCDHKGVAITHTTPMSQFPESPPHACNACRSGLAEDAPTLRCVQDRRPCTPSILSVQNRPRSRTHHLGPNGHIHPTVSGREPLLKQPIPDRWEPVGPDARCRASRP